MMRLCPRWQAVGVGEVPVWFRSLPGQVHWVGSETPRECCGVRCLWVPRGWETCSTSKEYSSKYRQVIKATPWPRQGVFYCTKREVFQQDSAPAQTNKLVHDWLEKVDVDYIRDWLGNTHELNPTESLWSLIIWYLRDHDTSTVPKLVKEIKDIWE